MLTSESSVGRSSHVVTDLSLGRLRTLTPLECERLNGFPDNWTNTGMPEKMRYFCMGNALVVKIVQRIAEQIIKMLEDNE
jgi:DNA (cytosine-5)-methyltransferase 1